MNAKLSAVFLITLALLVLVVPPARADGIIIPDTPICDGHPCPPPPCPAPEPCPPLPPSAQLAIRYHHVQITINDQVALTHVDQVFYNPNDWQVEGTYIFPIPHDAAVTAFTLWVDGKPVEAQILEAEAARQKYEDIVRNLRDPALLEYAGRGAVQARIFPIPPRGERRVELEYTQALSAENGLVRYLYPLNTEKFSALPIESVAINVVINSSIPIRAVYSPTHKVSVNRQSPYHVEVGYEAKDVRPDADFAVYYSLGEEQALHLLTQRNPNDSSDPDGYFLLLLAPRPTVDADISIPKDVLLVLDRSGSMEGEKFRQAQQALRYILRHLNAEDRFNIIAFSTGVELFASEIRPATDLEEALAWVDRLSAQGSTNIQRALLEAAALAVSERPTYLIFLTDGLPTVGEVDSQRILEDFQEQAPKNLRLFAFGVGYDVDTFLLDSLAQAHHGTSSYVLPGEQIDEVVSDFYARVSTPVLTNLHLDFGDLPVYDLYPSPLPDLFAGSQIVVVGRYRQGGVTDVILTGEVNGQTQTFEYPGQKFASESVNAEMQSSIPRLWATRKIGYLLNQVRLQGPDPETIDQIVGLSIRYGIVTPYTSYLVTEELPLGAAAQERIAGAQYNQMLSTPAPISGQEAVQKAADQGALSAAEAPLAPSLDVSQRVRIVGSRTFVWSQGVWIDTAFDPETMTVHKVAFLSDDYFLLSRRYPELAAAFALGSRVIGVTQGVAYEVVEEGSSVPPLELPATPAIPAASPTPASALDLTPTAQVEPEERPTAPGSMPCASGLLPLIVLVALFVGKFRRR